MEDLSLTALTYGLDGNIRKCVESQTLLDLIDRLCDTEVFFFPRKKCSHPLRGE
jgi:hypothetical protein